eukprot:1690363-Ditylum_brightwellii.AAC.1
MVDIDNTGHDPILEKAIFLAIHVAAHLKQDKEPMPREDMMALAKLLAEAGLEKKKTILGWIFDFRWFIISLPDNK